MAYDSHTILLFQSVNIYTIRLRSGSSFHNFLTLFYCAYCVGFFSLDKSMKVNTWRTSSIRRGRVCVSSCLVMSLKKRTLRCVSNSGAVTLSELPLHIIIILLIIIFLPYSACVYSLEADHHDRRALRTNRLSGE